jgi:hypothetical protein
VRRLVKIALIALGIRWFLKWRKRRREGPEEELPTGPPATSSGPADELRQKLAASRVEDEPDDPGAAPASVTERRSEVHEQARATLDDMKSPDEG